MCQYVECMPQARLRNHLDPNKLFALVNSRSHPNSTTVYSRDTFIMPKKARGQCFWGNLDNLDITQ